MKLWPAGANVFGAKLFSALFPLKRDLPLAENEIFLRNRDHYTPTFHFLVFFCWTPTPGIITRQI